MLRLALLITAVLGICYSMAWYVGQDRPEQKKVSESPEGETVPPKSAPAARSETLPTAKKPSSTAKTTSGTKQPKPAPPSLIPAIPNTLEDVFSTGQKLTKQLDDVVQDQLALSEAEEIDIGSALRKHLVREKSLWKNPQVLARIHRLSEPILRERSRQKVAYSFYLLDEEQVNAFSHLGGHVYITKGLINLQPSDAELEAVLGHEIAHVDLKHCVQKLTYAARASQIGGDQAARLVQLGYQLIAVGYSEDQEFDADAWSYKTMLKLGRSKHQATEFLRRLAKLEANGENPRGEKNATLLGRLNTQVQNHFRSHPPTEIRLRQLEQLP